MSEVMNMEYIIVHTRYGYMSNVSDGFSSDFSKDIANAVRFTNFEQVKTLCDTHMACAWVCENGKPIKMCYEPSNTINHDMINRIRRNMYAK